MCVQRAWADAATAVIVEATIRLGHALGLRVVAEGAEDVATWRRLGVMGCDLVQGYVLSRPLPADALPDWLLERGAGQAAA